MDKTLQQQKKLVLFTIQTIILLALGLVALYLIRSIIVVWFVAFILMTALNPMVDVLVRRKIPRMLAILMVMVMVVLFFALLLAGIIPTLIRETGALITYITTNLDYFQNFQIDTTLLNQFEAISRGALNIVKILGSTLSNVIGVLSLFVLTIYMLIERYRLKYALRYAFRGPLAVNKAEHFISEVENKLGGWVRAEVVLMLIIGVLSYVGLLFMGVPFALPLAIIAGLLELIPNIGPIVSAIPAIAAGLTVSPSIALGVSILYIAIQQAENHLIVPLVMKQSAGLNPLITLFCLMTGASLGGVTGAILGVPIFIAVVTVIRAINHENHLQIPVPQEE